MRKGLLTIFGVFFIIFTMAACTFHFTEAIGGRLKAADLYPRFENRVVNLGAGSKCPENPTVKLVNSTTKVGNYLIAVLGAGGHRYYVKPKKLTSYIINYLRTAFNRCNVKSGHDSKKVINVSLKRLRLLLEDHFVFHRLGGDIALKIEIPEIKYKKIYEATDWTPRPNEMVLAFVIHRAVFKIIHDPVVQDYILCRNRQSPGATSADAQYKLGLRYQNDQGVPRDYRKAAKLYSLAANRGHSEAQFRLGLMYYNGRGVPRNYVRAYMWISLASSRGHKDGPKLLDVLERKMTRSQRAEAQRLTAEWKPRRAR